MVSKRRLSYSLRMFLPWITITWLMAFVLMWHQYYTVKKAQEEINRQTITMIVDRIIDGYANDNDMRQFINFADEYILNKYDDFYLIVFDNEEQRIAYNIGGPTLLDGSELFQRTGNDVLMRSKDIDTSGFWNYTHRTSNDGKIDVIAAVPYTATLKDILFADGAISWIWIVATLAIFTFFGLITSRFLGRNVTLLKEFAQNAANSDFNYKEYKFPHDELGDISREIVKLYHEKDEAVTQTQKEHAIALHAVEEKARIKKRLTNDINHELKTPIGIIKGYIDTLVENPDIDEATRDRFLMRTQQNVDRLRNLLEDVNTMTRLEEGSGNIPVAEIDFHDLVFTLENDARMSGITGDMKFKFDLPLDCKVKGNNNLLNGMLANLIRNAAHHSHGTEMGLRMVVESDNYYTFSFYDNGTGVEAENLPHLFERFFRVDAGRSRKEGGTGLGLPIVKKTIEALGGSVSVHNRAEGGLEFLFTLEKWVPKTK